MNSRKNEVNEFREKMNARILESSNLTIKRFFNLDTNAYEEGKLSPKIKEMLGLSASMVLRCDDCIRYHLDKCIEYGLSNQEVMEIFAIANLVGGTIVIPHTRRALEYWEELKKGE